MLKILSRCLIINYSNPTGLVTEALNKVCNVKVAGLCAGGMRPRWWAAEALNIPEEKIYYDYLGLNHMNFSYNMTIDGRPITDEEFSKVIKMYNCFTRMDGNITLNSESVYTILFSYERKSTTIKRTRQD